VYDVLAPLSEALPPIPGVVSEHADAVRAYAAIVGRVPVRHAVAPTLPTPRDDSDHAAEAERLYAAGEFRAAARQWRLLAEQVAQQHGESHPTVFDCRLRAARAHLPLGEPDRALRLLDRLLQQHTKFHGPEHPPVAQLRQEIAELRAEHPTTQ
jgi:hypothetical protein